MFKITNITDEPHQIQTIVTDTGNITLTLRYHSIVEAWGMNITYNDKSVYGLKISLGVHHSKNFNFPFDFVCTGSQGLDPFQINDFLTNRCELYFVTAEEMEEVRGIAI